MMKPVEVELDLKIFLRAEYTPAVPGNVWTIPGIPAQPAKLSLGKVSDITVEGASILDFFRPEELEALLDDPGVRVRIIDALR